MHNCRHRRQKDRPARCSSNRIDGLKNTKRGSRSAPASMVAPVTGLGEILFEEFERPLAGNGGGRLVVAVAEVVAEAVAGVVDVDRDFGMGRGDPFAIGGADVRVARTEVKNDGTLWLQVGELS